MQSSPLPALIRQTLVGLLLVALSLPVLLLLHHSFGLGMPPVTGIMVLGGAVVLTFALCGVLGWALAKVPFGGVFALVLGFLLGGFISLHAAPLYGALVIEGLTRDATYVAASEQDHLTGAARGELTSRAWQTFYAAREGRLQQQLAAFRQEAEDATTPQARDIALQKAKSAAGDLLVLGRERGILLLKNGVARSSAFTLLLWAILGAPLGAAYEARKARRTI